MHNTQYPRFREVLAYAAEKHDGQVRKGTDIPYITHPVAVAEVLCRNKCSPEVVYAGLLHDVIEDTGVAQEVLAQEFGTTVAALVAAVSEKKTTANEKIPWEVRKLRQLAVLQEEDDSVALLKAADVWHNLSTLAADYACVGEAVWSRFNAGKYYQLWYYSTLCRMLIAKLGTHDLARQLQKLLDDFLTACRCSQTELDEVGAQVHAAAADYEKKHMPSL